MTTNQTSKEKVDALPSTLEIDLAVQSAMQNAYDMGLREDADDDGEAFWSEVLSQVTNR